ncbi:phytoene/squalene synthase family protein [Halocola ammonii]
MKEIFDNVSIACSRKTTKAYSTSFSIGIRFLNPRFRDPIYSVYGFVRFADEIVDTFHDYDKEDLLKRFWDDTHKAIDEGISLNPILNSFQKVYHDYNFDRELVDTFLQSMEMDLHKHEYSQAGYEKYILGSAEVVGLMCLKIFTENNIKLYKQLRPFAMRLGAAFQKINFLRDLHADFLNLGRSYFPGIDIENFDDNTKKQIEEEIEEDFKIGLAGIKKLPKDARFGVYVAYVYYTRLFNKIKRIPSHRIMNERVRIPNQRKYALFVHSYFRHSLNVL